MDSITNFILDALNTFFGWLFKNTVLRFVSLTSLYAIFVEFVDWLISLKPTWMTFNGAFDGVSPTAWFFVDFFALDFGLPLIVSAWVIRFLIRRIPVIG